MIIRDRIKELRRVRAAELEGAPWNWRTHPAEQRAAVAGSLEELGITDPLKVRELDGGRLQLWDGHLRQEILDQIGPDTMVPVVVTDLSEAEAKKALLIHDPLAGMAEADPAKLDALIAEVDAENEALERLIADMTPEDTKPRPAENEEYLLESAYAVLIKCKGEPEQKAVLKELDRHGLDVRALVVESVKEPPKEVEPPAEIAVGEVEIVRRVEVARTPRVMQMEGMFDVPPTRQSETTWRFKMQLDRPWNVGLIVGPSGSGKSTVARELFGDELIAGWPWSPGKAVIDDFPERMGTAEIAGLLSSVGFSSPPSWLKPFRVLSNGEQFRVNLARTLAEQPDLAVIDEFTSVVDRTVAKIGSAALAKAVRGGGRRLIAVACHYDIEEWLQPDWKLEMPSGEFTWRSLRRRPGIQLRVRRCGREWWDLFGRHHYLTHSIGRAVQCFLGEVDGRPAAFTAVVAQPHKSRFRFREHRTVCHPDFQGVGIGNAMSELVAGCMVCVAPYTSTTSHPAMIRHRLRSPRWKCKRPPLLSAITSCKMTKTAKYKKANSKSAALRVTASFEYVGPADEATAEALGVL